VTRPKWKLVKIRSATVLIFTQDRCMVCAKCTIGSVIVLDAPDGTPRLRGSCGILFRSVWRWCLSRCKIGAWFVQNVPYDQKSFWTLPMLLLGDEAQVEAHFGPFGDSAKLYASYIHGLRRTYHKLGNHFGRT
jgi:hypothetical protein